MALFLAMSAYLGFGIFCWRVIWRFLLRLRSEPEASPAGEHTCASRVMTVVDILFLRRLFLVNKGLWAGEWIFHASFVLVGIRHLRYILEPGWGCLGWVQPLGLAAGYALPFSLLYILLYRLLIERGRYVSGQNLLLTLLMLVTATTGVLLHAYFRTDVIGIKHFMLSLLAFEPVNPVASRSFVLHFVSAMAFLPFVPSHLFAAPLTLLDARRREENRGRLLHD